MSDAVLEQRTHLNVVEGNKKITDCLKTYNLYLLLQLRTCAKLSQLEPALECLSRGRADEDSA